MLSNFLLREESIKTLLVREIETRQWLTAKGKQQGSLTKWEGWLAQAASKRGIENRNEIRMETQRTSMIFNLRMECFTGSTGGINQGEV
jgi:hypothetical protein